MAITGTANPATAAAGSADTISGTVSDPSGQGVPTGVVTLAVSLMSPAAQQHARQSKSGCTLLHVPARLLRSLEIEQSMYIFHDIPLVI